jgi:hypothetical protein
MTSAIALVAFAAAQAAAPQASGPKWVPLQQAQAQQMGVSVTTPVAPATTATIAPAAPQAVILAPAGPSVLHAGVEVPLRLEEPLNSNDRSLREGQQFRMSVANNVMLGNVVVIPAGSPATGEIVEIRRKGMWGKSGHIIARAINARVGDRLIRLTGNFDEKGTAGGVGAVAVSALVFAPAGFFMTGTSAKIQVGAGVRAFLDEDLTIAAPQAVAPMATVPAAVVAPVAPAAPVPVSVQPVAAKPN